jgi:repressor LexA
MEPLTEKQRAVLEFIEAALAKNSPPSQREIAEHFGLAQNSIHQIVWYLRSKGYIDETSGHRVLRLSKEYAAALAERQGTAIIGTVAAGEPLLAEENIEERVDVNKLLGIGGGVFLLRVTGDSMIDEGIMDGDLVAVNPAGRVENGQIAVVLLDDEATVKRVYFQKNRIALKPANKAAGYAVRYIRLSEKDVRIIGKVTGCIRAV